MSDLEQARAAVLARMLAAGLPPSDRRQPEALRRDKAALAAFEREAWLTALHQAPLTAKQVARVLIALEADALILWGLLDLETWTVATGLGLMLWGTAGVRAGGDGGEDVAMKEGIVNPMDLAAGAALNPVGRSGSYRQEIADLREQLKQQAATIARLREALRAVLDDISPLHPCASTGDSEHCEDCAIERQARAVLAETEGICGSTTS